MTDKTEPPVPDLRSLLAEASRPAASVTVPLNQGLREQIRQAEADLHEIAKDAPAKRMGAASPVKAKAQEIQALRDRMAASEMTFHFEALTHKQQDRIRQEMGGRDNRDEMNLRAIAAMCTKVTGPDGHEFPERMRWEDFRDLRESLGNAIFDATIDDAANRASGAEGWSVPFSSAASLILGTEK